MTPCPLRPTRSGLLFAYLAASFGVAGLTALTLPLQGRVEPTNLVMLYLLLVVGVALRFPRGPAAWCALSSVLAFDYFHIPPHRSFVIGDVQYLLTFCVMLLVGLTLAHLTARLRLEAELAASGAHGARLQYELARELAGCIDLKRLPGIVNEFLARELGAKAWVWCLRSDERLECLGEAPASPKVMQALLETTLHEGRPKEQADLYERDRRLLLLPMDAPMRRRGVLAISIEAARLSPLQRQMLEAISLLIAIAIERLHSVNVAQAATLEMERERLRGTLLSTLSHDLRTPLTIMVGQADALCEAEGKRAGELALALREQAMRMNELVNKLLDMARLQSGATALRMDWQSMEEIMGAATAHLGDRLGPERLEIVLPEDLPLIEFDAVLIERVICNLLENAVKYGPPEGKIRLSATLEASAVRVSVEDEGPGISDRARARLFEPFVRGESVAGIPGLGLGLSICRIIVEAHGGQLEATNRPEGGACLSFTLPRSTPPSLAEEAEAKHA